MSKIAYATKVENSGATAAGRASAADINEIKASVNAIYDEYTSYVARLTQSGSGAPTMVVLHNDTGLTFGSASRAGTGSYLIVVNTPQIEAKTAVFGGDVNIAYFFDGEILNINTYVGGVLTDSALNGQTVEIRIYP